MKQYEAVGVLTKKVYATGDYIGVRRSLLEKFPTHSDYGNSNIPVFKEAIRIRPVKKGW